MNDAKRNAPAEKQEQKTVKVELCIDSKALAQAVYHVYAQKEGDHHEEAS